MKCYYNENIAFFYNRSGKYLATEWNTVSKLVMGLGITVCIFIMLANLLVMVAIYVNRRFHFPIYYLMANLAAADFFAGLAYFYLMFNTGPNTRRLTVSTWLLRQGLIDTSLTASVANLLAIAIERHITVFRMQLHTRMSNRRVVVVIVVIWTMAIVMGAIPSVGWNCICDITHCSNMAPLYSDSYLVFWAVFNLVTFLVMVVLYAHIFGYVRQRTMRMSRHSSGPRRNRDTMMSLLKTVVIVLGEYLLQQKCFSLFPVARQSFRTLFPWIALADSIARRPWSPFSFFFFTVTVCVLDAADRGVTAALHSSIHLLLHDSRDGYQSFCTVCCHCKLAMR
uniref:G-protein coupled receptors family 1 profile domain-containing protein n=1 Tax=Gopherus agassizii TaxID=38772 RepID=A0A452GSM2_9SAUR